MKITDRDRFIKEVEEIANKYNIHYNAYNSKIHQSVGSIDFNLAFVTMIEDEE